MEACAAARRNASVIFVIDEEDWDNWSCWCFRSGCGLGEEGVGRGVLGCENCSKNEDFARGDAGWDGVGLTVKWCEWDDDCVWGWWECDGWEWWCNEAIDAAHVEVIWLVPGINWPKPKRELLRFNIGADCCLA